MYFILVKRYQYFFNVEVFTGAAMFVLFLYSLVLRVPYADEYDDFTMLIESVESLDMGEEIPS